MANQPKLETYKLFFEQIPEPKSATKLRGKRVLKQRMKYNLLETSNAK